MKNYYMKFFYFKFQNIFISYSSIRKINIFTYCTRNPMCEKYLPLRKFEMA